MTDFTRTFQTNFALCNCICHTNAYYPNYITYFIFRKSRKEYSDRSFQLFYSHFAKILWNEYLTIILCVIYIINCYLNLYEDNSINDIDVSPVPNTIAHRYAVCIYILVNWCGISKLITRCAINEPLDCKYSYWLFSIIALIIPNYSIVYIVVLCKLLCINIITQRLIQLKRFADLSCK